jgi:hypothetical protein
MSGKQPVLFNGEMPGLNTEPVTVPLVIYIGDERRIIGEANVVCGVVEAHIHPATEGSKDLADLITGDVIRSVSLTFNAPPALPFFEDGRVKWRHGIWPSEETALASEVYDGEEGAKRNAGG